MSHDSDDDQPYMDEEQVQDAFGKTSGTANFMEAVISHNPKSGSSKKGTKRSAAEVESPKKHRKGKKHSAVKTPRRPMETPPPPADRSSTPPLAQTESVSAPPLAHPFDGEDQNDVEEELKRIEQKMAEEKQAAVNTTSSTTTSSAAAPPPPGGAPILPPLPQAPPPTAAASASSFVNPSVQTCTIPVEVCNGKSLNKFKSPEALLMGCMGQLSQHHLYYKTLDVKKFTIQVWADDEAREKAIRFINLDRAKAKLADTWTQKDEEGWKGKMMRQHLFGRKVSLGRVEKYWQLPMENLIEKRREAEEKKKAEQTKGPDGELDMSDEAILARQALADSKKGGGAGGGKKKQQAAKYDKDGKKIETDYVYYLFGERLPFNPKALIATPPMVGSCFGLGIKGETDKEGVPKKAKLKESDYCYTVNDEPINYEGYNVNTYNPSATHFYAWHVNELEGQIHRCMWDNPLFAEHLKKKLREEQKEKLRGILINEHPEWDVNTAGTYIEENDEGRTRLMNMWKTAFQDKHHDPLVITSTFRIDQLNRCARSMWFRRNMFKRVSQKDQQEKIRKRIAEGYYDPPSAEEKMGTAEMKYHMDLPAEYSQTIREANGALDYDGPLVFIMKTKQEMINPGPYSMENHPHPVRPLSWAERENLSGKKKVATTVYEVNFQEEATGKTGPTGCRVAAVIFWNIDPVITENAVSAKKQWEETACYFE